jgi:hypothetical protein
MGEAIESVLADAAVARAALLLRAIRQRLLCAGTVCYTLDTPRCGLIPCST